jgi:hypothetical protein
MPTILSRLRGLMAPVALDEPLRLQDGFSGIIVPGGGGPSSGGGPGRPGDDGARGRSVRGRRGAPGASGASGGQPPGAYWVPIGGIGLVTLPINAVEKPVMQSGSINRCLVYAKSSGFGSCRIKVYKANISSHYPPTSSDDITGGNDVVMTSAIDLDDSTLTGWTKTFVAGDFFLFTLSSVSNLTSVGISLFF